MIHAILSAVFFIVIAFLAVIGIAAIAVKIINHMVTKYDCFSEFTIKDELLQEDTANHNNESENKELP